MQFLKNHILAVHPSSYHHHQSYQPLHTDYFFFYIFFFCHLCINHLLLCSLCINPPLLLHSLSKLFLLLVNFQQVWLDLDRCVVFSPKGRASPISPPNIDEPLCRPMTAPISNLSAPLMMWHPHLCPLQPVSTFILQDKLFLMNLALLSTDIKCIHPIVFTFILPNWESVFPFPLSLCLKVNSGSTSDIFFPESFLELREQYLILLLLLFSIT